MGPAMFGVMGHIRISLVHLRDVPTTRVFKNSHGKNNFQRDDATSNTILEPLCCIKLTRKPTE